MYSHTNLDYFTINEVLNNQSQSVLVNKFNANINPEQDQDTIDCLLSDIINDVLLLEGGLYENTPTECSTPIEHRNIRQAEGDTTYDNRLQYWKNYIKTRDDIKKRIQQQTKKKDHEILLNKSQENDRTRLVKTIMDQSERLNPSILASKTPNQLSKRSCTLYETLPKFERVGETDFEIFDIPQGIQKETSLPCYNVPKSSWLSSKILASKIYSYKNNIERLIEFYPDINELQVIGQQKTIHDRNPQIIEENNMKAGKVFYGPEIELRIMDADSLRPKEKLPHYILVLNDTILDYNKKEFKSYHFNIMFDAMFPFQKQHRSFLNITNCGNKVIDFKWIPQKPKYKNISTIFNRLGSFTPSFYFNKNPFRLPAGGFKKKMIYFSCYKLGIYAETWILETEPNFLQNNAKIYCHIFGSCTPCSRFSKKFYNLKSSLTESANDIMANNFITNLAGCLPIPKPDPAYIHGFTDEELFVSMYPQMNVSNRYLEELKNLYRDLRLYHPSPSVYPARWNFDLNELKRMIFAVDNEKKRKDFYTRFIDIIDNIKNLPCKQSDTICEEQKYILVRSVILTTMERIDQLANELKDSLLETELNLDFNEILLMDREKIPESRRFSIKDVDNISIDSSKSYWIVKSESIKEKRLKLLHDTLYLQFSKHLGVMAEEIVAVIEGIKNIF